MFTRPDAGSTVARVLLTLLGVCLAVASPAKAYTQAGINVRDTSGAGRQLLATLPNVTTNPDPVAAEAQCCAILQSVGFTRTPGVPVFVVDTNGKAVGGGGLGQNGQPITGNNNGQDAQWVPMQVCTCSAGVTNATYSGPGRVRLRGGNNSALRDTIRQYYIKLPQSEPLGGLPENKNWVFRGPQNDTLGLHEYLAMNLSGELGWWSPRTKYGELFLIEDGQPIDTSMDYRGITVLEEHVDQNKNRLNIAKLRVDDEDITGGYIIEYKHGDNPKNEPEINCAITGMPWIVKYPGGFNMTKLNYLQGYMNDFEAALFAPNFKDPVEGWRKFANPVTFVDWFLIMEIAKNAKHTYHGTSFANKDKGKRLDMGPVWSPKNGFGTCCGFPVDGFNNGGVSNGTSGGSAISPSGWLFNICNETSRCTHDPSFPLALWFVRLWEDPAFVQDCVARWTQMRAIAWSDASIAASLSQVQGYLLPTALRGFARWADVLLAPYGVTDPTAFYNQAFTTLSSWTLQRVAWLDGAFRDVAAAGNVIVPYGTAPSVATAG
ncbi:hypothetical protein ABBQ32_005741 [Trebouxia sp. C0010 RCD-2024]